MEPSISHTLCVTEGALSPSVLGGPAVTWTLGASDSTELTHLQLWVGY